MTVYGWTKPHIHWERRFSMWRCYHMHRAVAGLGETPAEAFESFNFMKDRP